MNFLYHKEKETKKWSLEKQRHEIQSCAQEILPSPLKSQFTQMTLSKNGLMKFLDWPMTYHMILEIFTEGEIHQLMLNADDNNFNKPDINEDGYAHIIHDVLCMNLWLAYLETGRRMYGDVYVPDEGIEKVKKHY